MAYKKPNVATIQMTLRVEFDDATKADHFLGELAGFLKSQNVTLPDDIQPKVILNGEIYGWLEKDGKKELSLCANPK